METELKPCPTYKFAIQTFFETEKRRLKIKPPPQFWNKSSCVLSAVYPIPHPLITDEIHWVFMSSHPPMRVPILQNEKTEDTERGSLNSLGTVRKEDEENPRGFVEAGSSSQMAEDPERCRESQGAPSSPTRPGGKTPLTDRRQGGRPPLDPRPQPVASHPTLHHTEAKDFPSGFHLDLLRLR
ncbi:hypothetical protein CDAR_249151 [Caerostris darwini]|uniref:Uncharacterized protein n=1 Tax=Caerostris darwini TaxID=1538125 RepID=A0AAV4SFU4_9ARAC|nr:hypothetical protein CDAR_249151 [Caerostris darwini]